MSIINANILSTDTAVITVPAGKKYAITTMLVCNYAPTTDTVYNSTFNAYAIKANDSKSVTNLFLNSVSLPAQETFTFSTERLILDEGDKIVMNSPDNNRLSTTISYLEV